MVLIFDNYDSFTWNLVHLVERFTDNFFVFRNDEIGLDEIEHYGKILISPGPGLPKDAGIMMELLKNFSERKSILGVCLGMQGIVQHFGGALNNLEEVKHGVAASVRVTAPDELLFSGIPPSFEAGLYYSWAAERASLPDELKITAEDEQGNAMAVSHRELDVKGVQFHPESIMTEYGKQIIGNWLDS